MMSATTLPVRERPILFSGPMVRSILADQKTQTRRVMKPQPPEWIREFGYTCMTPPGHISGRGYWKGVPGEEGPGEKFFPCPHGAVGDRLWVRETFALQTCVDGEEPPFADGRPIWQRPESDWDGLLPLWTQPHYRATDPAPDLCCECERCAQCRDGDAAPHWRPSIFMPRWASRITLELTGVRVERVQEISEADAIAEGCSRDYNDVPWCTDQACTHRGAQWHFRSIWDSLNAKRGYGWDLNPWVWVLAFRRITP